jgi:hypothetical protein
VSHHLQTRFTSSRYLIKLNEVQLTFQQSAMTDINIPEETFASGRYSKRKRTQVTYHLDELDFSDSESDFDSPQAKVRCTSVGIGSTKTDQLSIEADGQGKLQTTSQAQGLPFHGTSSGN